MPFEQLRRSGMALALGFALVLAPGLHGVSYAATLVLGFDDLPAASGPVPFGYGSLSWSNAWAYAPGGAGYLNGVVSPQNVAYAFGGGIVTISATVPGASFDLNSVYLTAALSDGAVVAVRGFRSGAWIYYAAITVDTLGPTLAVLSFLDVDRVEFASSGGVTNPTFDSGALYPGSYFAMDDLSITVPEPAGMGLLAAASAALALLRMVRR